MRAGSVEDPFHPDLELVRRGDSGLVHRYATAATPTAESVVTEAAIGPRTWLDVVFTPVTGTQLDVQASSLAAGRSASPVRAPRVSPGSGPTRSMRRRSASSTPAPRWSPGSSTCRSSPAAGATPTATRAPRAAARSASSPRARRSSSASPAASSSRRRPARRAADGARANVKLEIDPTAGCSSSPSTASSSSSSWAPSARPPAGSCSTSATASAPCRSSGASPRSRRTSPRSSSSAFPVRQGHAADQHDRPDQDRDDHAPGIGPNGTDVTRPSTSRPQSSPSSWSARRASSPGTATDLVRLQGGFYLAIDPTEFHALRDRRAVLRRRRLAAHLRPGDRPAHLDRSSNPGIAGMPDGLRRRQHRPAERRHACSAPPAPSR